MKKKNLKSLALNKKVISKINNQLKGGVFRTAGCYTVQICPIDPLSSECEPLEPINVDSWGSCHPCATIIC
ncbi:hypothetical protein [uncultured Lacinutrix sp.]|uniref:hypothetical protein n=1 Tax=uncultured Lacinutrix sp. TaxID=574032 RepID=UPI00261F1982|nr:hypothetical protein [uncultured Lacinutrix sp.]